MADKKSDEGVEQVTDHPVALLRDIGQAAKTSPTSPEDALACLDCGSMNPPSEWYCEQCGAELAWI